MSIVVAGYTGLAGSAIFNFLKSSGEDVIGINSQTLNLCDRRRTFEYIKDIKPQVVIDAAAIVGGIGANDSYPVEFLSKNLQIQSNLMDASHDANVERFIFLGSSCIYPKGCPQPMKEEFLMTGPLEPTNSAYAVAKIAGIELIKAYRKQYQRNWISVMPTNLYGPRDNFSVQNGHVLPAFINKFVTAADSGAQSITLWGSGTPRREFLHSQDLAEATFFLLNNYDGDSHINVGTGEELQVRELANLVARQSGFKGSINWDSSKPDGSPRKLLDVSHITSLGWSSRITISEGIRDTIGWFKDNQSKVRR